MPVVSPANRVHRVATFTGIRLKTVGPNILTTPIRSFTPGAAALVFASDEYEQADYIRDYDEFVEWVRT